MSMTYSCSCLERSPGCLVKMGLPGQEGQCPSDIYPPWMGMHIWAWLVEEYVWVHRLEQLDPTHGTHNFHMFHRGFLVGIWLPVLVLGSVSKVPYKFVCIVSRLLSCSRRTASILCRLIFFIVGDSRFQSSVGLVL